MFRKTGVFPSVRYPHLPDPSHGTAMDTYRTHRTYDGTDTGTDSNNPETESLDTLGLPELVEKGETSFFLYFI